MEKGRLEARRELQELRRQAKVAETDRAGLTQNVQELQQKITRDDEREKEMRKEIQDLKQKVRHLLIIYGYHSG